MNASAPEADGLQQVCAPSPAAKAAPPLNHTDRVLKQIAECLCVLFHHLSCREVTRGVTVNLLTSLAIYFFLNM